MISSFARVDDGEDAVALGVAPAQRRDLPVHAVARERPKVDAVAVEESVMDRVGHRRRSQTSRTMMTAPAAIAKIAVTSVAAPGLGAAR